MTTTTDLLRRSAELLRLTYKPGSQCARDLDDLADEWERAEPVAVRKWHDEFKCWNYDDIEDVLPTHSGERLYTHPAPEVQRDAERWRYVRDYADLSFDRHVWVTTDSGQRVHVRTPCRGREADEAVDAAMQELKS